MSSAKPRIHLRMRQDRFDLLKEMNEILNERLVSGGGQPISFNRFMEDMVESFLVSKGGMELCEAVQEKRLEKSNEWKEMKKGNAPKIEEWV